MTDDFANLFDQPRPTATFETRIGVVILTIRPNTRSNLDFIADVMAREAAPPVESEAADAPKLSRDEVKAKLVSDLHAAAAAFCRRNVAKMTIDGVDRTDAALPFLCAFAEQDAARFGDLLMMAHAAPDKQEASPDAIAGE